MATQVNVTLHGANGTHQATLEPKADFPTPTQSSPPLSSSETSPIVDASNARRCAFATMRELEQQFSELGICHRTSMGIYQSRERRRDTIETHISAMGKGCGRTSVCQARSRNVQYFRWRYSR